MDNHYNKGDLIRIKTKNDEVIEGLFYEMSIDKSRITISDIKKSFMDKPSDGILHYFEQEIQYIVKLEKCNEQKYLKMDQKDFEEAILISKNYIYINQVDKRFNKAVADLKKQSHIALSTDGASLGRKSEMPFLVLSTRWKIYIFDVQVMQYHAFDAGLKQLLESEVPKKIVHDCRTLSDCLMHKHNVKLHSVFDTQVGDLIIFKNKKGLLPKNVNSLSDCLHSYLGMPKNIIIEKHDIIQMTERPLSIKIKESVTKNIAFLHYLFEAIDKELKLPFLRGVECYIKSIQSCDDYEAWAIRSNPYQIPHDFKNAIKN